jgi:ABC-type multidrug transport system permease subunit
MNLMFGCLFGVGYVIVRYRKNGFLKRLKATPLRAIEFIIAQVLSRLILAISMAIFIYVGASFILETRMEGSYFTLLLVGILGATSLISLGLLIASRVSSEELAGGLLNLMTWPMMVLSGVFFSLEGSPQWIQTFANIFPLTHTLTAARAVMIDGATILEISYELSVLVATSIIFMIAGALLFKWQSD